MPAPHSVPNSSSNVPPALLAQIDKLAKNRQLPQSAILLEALTGYIAAMEQLESAVQKGREDVS